MIASLPKNKTQFGRAEVEHLIKTVRPELNLPKSLKVGDVITVRQNKSRPAVIVKVLEENVIVIPLSTTEDANNLIETKGRFFGGEYFSKCFITVNMEHALKNFIGMYDHRSSLNEAKKQLKLFLIENL